MRMCVCEREHAQPSQKSLRESDDASARTSRCESDVSWWCGSCLVS